MSDVKVLKIEKTEELKFWGVAHVELFGKIVLRFKVIEKKDGSGVFVTPPSYKREIDGQDHWAQWFMIDSQFTNEEITNQIMSVVNQAMNQQSQSFGSNVQSTAQSQPQAQPQFGGDNSEEDEIPF